MNSDFQVAPAPLRSGKVRDVYDAGEHLIIVASDRISAFDCILPTPIDDKGKVLCTLSKFWFERTTHIIENHLIGFEADDFPAPFDEFADDWQGRAMLVRRAEVLPIECVVRGYLAGSGWAEYQKSNSICGVKLPSNFQQSQQLPQPIFTPTTKAEAGHDLPIDFEQAADIIGTERAIQVRDVSLRLYQFAADYARQRGVIIADTKFEFGIYQERLILIDEIFTPDSSRFWDAATFEIGRTKDSFDKQFVRDYLETLGWNKMPPAPTLPPEIVAQTRSKYFEAYQRLTSQNWVS